MQLVALSLSVAFCFRLLAGGLAPGARGDESTARRESARGLLVVTPRRFQPQVIPYIRHKKKSLPTELVSIEQVRHESAGSDAPEKLKRFLYQQWRYSRLGYVLLVGDADVMPVCYMVLDRITKPACDHGSDSSNARVAHAVPQYTAVSVT